MRGCVSGAAWICLICCNAALPSTTPLGSGPLAEPERDDEVLAGVRPRPRSAPPAADAATADGAAPSPDLVDAEDAGDAAQSSSGAEPEDAAPGGDAPEGGAVDRTLALVGEYLGHDVTTIRVAGLPERPSPDPNARIRVQRHSDLEIKIVIIYTPTGDPFCTLLGKVNGSRVTISAGQTCPEQVGGSSLSGTVTSGSAQLTGDRLTVELEADIEIEIGGRRAQGSMQYHFEGDRQ
jgi:hypothetical protein